MLDRDHTPKSPDTKIQREIEDYLYLSYYFSQGHPDAQVLLLDVGYNHYQNALHLIDRGALITNVVKKSLRMIRVGPHKHVKDSESSVDNEVTRTATILCEGPSTMLQSRDERDVEIVDAMIQFDDIFLHDRGRGHRIESYKGARFAPSLSMAAYYGLMLQSSRNPGFDAMFNDLHSRFAAAFRSDTSTTRAILATHLANRPQDVQTLERHKETCETCRTAV